jgi:hypothetical protein
MDPSRSGSTAREGEGDDLILDTLWTRVLEAWDEEKPHGAILDYAMRAGRLPELAGKYQALKDDADRGELAKKKVAALTIAAMNMLESTKTPRGVKVPRPITWTALFVSLVLLGLMYFALFDSARK